MTNDPEHLATYFGARAMTVLPPPETTVRRSPLLGSNHEGDTETVIQQWTSSAPEILPTMTHMHRRISENRRLKLSTRNSRRQNEKVYGTTACKTYHEKRKRTGYDKRRRLCHHNRNWPKAAAVEKCRRSQPVTAGGRRNF